MPRNAIHGLPQTHPEDGPCGTFLRWRRRNVAATARQPSIGARPLRGRLPSFAPQARVIESIATQRRPLRLRRLRPHYQMAELSRHTKATHVRWMKTLTPRNADVGRWDERRRAGRKQFHLLARSSCIASCFGIGGSLCLSLTTLPYYTAYTVGKILLAISVVGFGLSVASMSVGIRSRIRIGNARLDYALACIGFARPATTFLYTLYTHVLSGGFFVDWRF